MKVTLFLVLAMIATTFAATCPAPRCDTQWERNTLWSHPDITKFYQCAPAADGHWHPVEMKCAKGGGCCAFSYQDQVCVFFEDWKDC